MKKDLLTTFSLALALLLANTAGARAQTAATQGKTPAKVQREVIVEQDRIVVAGEPGEANVEVLPPDISFPRHPSRDTFVYVATEMSFGGKVVKGAPYSAESVTEHVQTFGDGNRIVNKNSANVYRDSEGRTRRDQTLAAIGPYAVEGDPPQTFFINDPVAGVNYILDPRSRTARKLALRGALGGERSLLQSGETKRRIEKEKIGETFTMIAPQPPPPHHGGPGPMVRQFSREDSNAKKESLGTKILEGVTVEGTRSTRTIPVGEIGNEQPINIVSERWYSPELQLVVMSKFSDPRMGETTYRLTNINRSEPSPALFQVPADYTIKEAGGVRTFMQRKPREKEEK